MQKLYVAGIGAGSSENMTRECYAALEEAELIVGYTKYVELVKPYFPDKEYLSTPMMKEADRCRLAVEEALKGKTTALVCSGDSGVYGMAGLVFEVGEKYPPLEIEVISGVTAALSGGAVLGAPLTHDFAVISLSDLLTPWELIEKRLANAADAELCIVLYNPASHKRSDYLKKACDIMLKSLSPDTVCGYVKNICREGESSVVTTLGKLRDEKVDMFTTVFIGNRTTKVINGKMVTPRGYRDV